MKTFIIYVKNNKKSEELANEALNSFSSYNGWEPTFFEGVHLPALPDWEKRYPLKMKELSRVASFLARDDNKLKYNTKKCCSMNHYRLFRKCVELGEPIAIIEHDSLCVANWREKINFDDVLVLNAHSAVYQEALRGIKKQEIKKGIHDIDLDLFYRHDPEIKGHLMPGTAAYSITPTGAQKMIDVYENVGWEQSDFIINTHYVRIQTIMPQLFTFSKKRNLRMSHGK
jgi:GR25 family glycosyltransferase involved in LPS biosynthesis